MQGLATEGSSGVWSIVGIPEAGDGMQPRPGDRRLSFTLTPFLTLTLTLKLSVDTHLQRRRRDAARRAAARGDHERVGLGLRRAQADLRQRLHLLPAHHPYRQRK